MVGKNMVSVLFVVKQTRYLKLVLIKKALLRFIAKNAEHTALRRTRAKVSITLSPLRKES